MAKTTKYVDTHSKSGEFTVHINKSLVPRLKNYAKSIDKTCSLVVNQAVETFLSTEERSLYEAMDKDALIDLLLKR